MSWWYECCSIALNRDEAHRQINTEHVAVCKKSSCHKNGQIMSPRSPKKPAEKLEDENSRDQEGRRSQVDGIKTEGQTMKWGCTESKDSQDQGGRRSQVRIMSVHKQLLPIQINANGLLQEPEQVSKQEAIPAKAQITQKSDGLMPFTRHSVRAMTRRQTNAAATQGTAAAAAIASITAGGNVDTALSSGNATSRKKTLQEGVAGLGAFRAEYQENVRKSVRKHTSAVLQREGLENGLSLDAPKLDISCCDPVTRANAEIMIKVVRGKDWKWSDEDGGPGKVGTVVHLNEDGTVSVYWHSLNEMKCHYRYAGAYDLCIAPPIMTRVKPKLNRRDSQHGFNKKDQTVIVFDWDDTLFPTTYIREDLELDHWLPLKDTHLKGTQMQEVAQKLSRCAAAVIELLQLASEHGHVILVTLAQSPWVFKSCHNFYPDVWDAICDLKIPIVYAQEGKQIDYNKADMMSDDEVESFWSAVKGKAIAHEVEKFYSQYEGQSWKNIISIGDSNFERLGTQGMAEDYAKQKLPGASTKSSESNTSYARRLSFEGEHEGHVIKVRTKTFKMVDDPEIDELLLEIQLLMKWLPLMVNLDDGFDVNLEFLNKPEVFQQIEDTLRG